MTPPPRHAPPRKRYARAPNNHPLPGGGGGGGERGSGEDQGGREGGRGGIMVSYYQPFDHPTRRQGVRGPSVGAVGRAPGLLKTLAPGRGPEWGQDPRAQWHFSALWAATALKIRVQSFGAVYGRAGGAARRVTRTRAACAGRRASPWWPPTSGTFRRGQAG